MVELGRLYCTGKGFDLLASLRKCNLLFTRNKITKQLAFLVKFFTLLLRNIAQISSHSFYVNQLIFIIFCM